MRASADDIRAELFSIVRTALDVADGSVPAHTEALRCMLATLDDVPVMTLQALAALDEELCGTLRGVLEFAFACVGRYPATKFKSAEECLADIELMAMRNNGKLLLNLWRDTMTSAPPPKAGRRLLDDTSDVAVAWQRISDQLNARHEKSDYKASAASWASIAARLNARSTLTSRPLLRVYPNQRTWQHRPDWSVSCQTRT